LNGSRPGDWAPVCDGEGSCQRRLPVGPSPLVCRMLEITEISNSGRRDLFGLFSKHYDDVDLPRFESDFTANDFALVLEYQGRPVAFTTASPVHIAASAARRCGRRSRRPARVGKRGKAARGA
jgi:hypothetical protein